MALPPAQNIGSIFAGALFYGLYLATLFHYIRWLVFTDEGWKIRRKISKSMLIITLSIWILSTVDKALEVEYAMQQVSPPTPAPFGTIKGLPWGTVVVCTGANIATLLADAVLIYRCWIIYEKSRLIVAFPVFFWFGGLMLTGLQAYGQIVQSALLLKDWQPVNRNAGGPGSILTPFWLCTIIMNIYATFMIVRRIYLVSKMSMISTSVDRLRYTMRILIESGFLYLTTAIAHFIVWFTPNTYAISIISGMNLSIEGIAFNLILIRAAQGRVEEKKANDLGPISDIRFTIAETKTSVGQYTPTPVDSSHGGDTGAMKDNEFAHYPGSSAV
ncbi:hypothetical protein BJ912DRAFT_927534 [Pholiota molesta]|nr:hypothetical protein BJ912DRAFT_927534 [Pholiota molesta]